MVLVPGTLETGNLALQNFDFAGVRIDAADLHLRLGFQCFQELPEADEIRIGVRMNSCRNNIILPAREKEFST